MLVTVNLLAVHPRKLAAVRREVALGAVGSAWEPAIGKVWPFIRSQPGLWSDGHNIFLYHHPTEPGAPILCDFGVEVTRTFETAGEVYATETPGGEAAVAVRRGPYNRMDEAHNAIRKWMAANRRGLRWTLVGDLWRSDAGPDRHRDDRCVPLKIAFALLAFDRQHGMWPEAPATGQGVPRALSVISPSKKHHLTQHRHRLSWVEQASRRSERIATTCACAIRLRAPGSLCQVRGMHPDQSKLESRVHRAAEAALSRQKYVSAIDVLCGMGLLATPHVDDWRKGRVDFLERVIQANLSKISSSMAIFRRWAGEKGLKPSETGYVRHTRGGTMALQFSKSGDPGIEKRYRTHYVSPALSEKKQQRLQEKLNQSPKPVVFQNLREAQCSECGAEIEQGSLLSMELEQPLCLNARVSTISSFFHRVTRR